MESNEILTEIRVAFAELKQIALQSQQRIGAVEEKLENYLKPTDIKHLEGRLEEHHQRLTNLEDEKKFLVRTVITTVFTLVVAFCGYVLKKLGVF